MSEIYKWNELKNVTKKYIINTLNLHLDKTSMYSSDDEYGILSLNEVYAEDLWNDFLVYIRNDIIKDTLAPEFMSKYSTSKFVLGDFESYGDSMDSDYMTIFPKLGTFIVYSEEYGEVEIGFAPVDLSFFDDGDYEEVALDVVVNHSKHYKVNKLINAYDNEVLFENDDADGETLKLTLVNDDYAEPMKRSGVSDIIKWIQRNVDALETYAYKIINAYINEVHYIYKPEELKYAFKYFLDYENPYVELDFDYNDNIKFIQFVE